MRNVLHRLGEGKRAIASHGRVWLNNVTWAAGWIRHLFLRSTPCAILVNPHPLPAE